MHGEKCTNKDGMRDGGEAYEDYPLGQYIVAAPGVCGGRPTFKYTRIDIYYVCVRLPSHSQAEFHAKIKGHRNFSWSRRPLLPVFHPCARMAICQTASMCVQKPRLSFVLVLQVVAVAA